MLGEAKGQNEPMTRRKRLGAGGGIDEKEEARKRHGRKGRDWQEAWTRKKKPE